MLAEVRKFKCKVKECEKKFKNKITLKSHMIVHSNDRPFECEKDKCEKKFKRKENLKQHMNIHSNNGCEKKFKTMRRRILHMSLHNADRKYVCEKKECGKKFVSSDQLY
jgi:uncharacterized Zn-finger protein